MTERAGERIGRYVLVRELASGEHRWLAFDPALQRRVQLDLEATDAAAAARAVAKVGDAAIVAVHDVGELQGRPFVAREYVAGTRIELAATRVASVAELRRWCLELARGLGALHAAGIAHAALDDPDSVVIDGGRGRIAGLARALVDADPGARRRDVLALQARLRAAIDAASLLGARALRSLRRELEPSDRELAEPCAALVRRLEADSGRERRRAVAATAIGVLALVGFVLLGRRLAGAGEAECAVASGAEVPGAWDPARAIRLRDAFLATGSPLAADAATATARTIDAYAGRWNELRLELCTAAAAPSRDRAMVCLDRRRAGLDALVRVLVEADAEIVARASQAAAALAVVDDCRDADAASEDAAPLPADPAARARTEEVHAAIADARALTSAGRYAQAVEAGLAVHAVGDTGVDGSLRARLALDIAIARGKAGDPERALDDITQAIALAWQARSAALAAAGWIEHAFTLAEYLKRPSEALHAIELAEATYGHAPTKPRMRARLLQVRGVVLFRLDRSSDARDALAESLAIREDLPSDDLGTAATLNSLANASFNLREFADAEPLYRRALALYRSVLEPDHPEIGSVHNNLCGMYYRMARNEDALLEGREAYRIRAAALGEDHPDTVSALDNVAIVLAALGRTEEAIALSERTLRTRERILPPGSVMIADSLVNYGNALLQGNRAADARVQFERALAIDIATNGERNYSTTVTMQNVARALEAEGRLGDALALYERVLVLRQSIPDMLDYNLVDTLMHVVHGAQTSGNVARGGEALEQVHTLMARTPMPEFAEDAAFYDARQRWLRGEREAATAEFAKLRASTSSQPLVQAIDAWLASDQPTGFVEG